MDEMHSIFSVNKYNKVIIFYHFISCWLLLEDITEPIAWKNCFAWLRELKPPPKRAAGYEIEIFSCYSLYLVLWVVGKLPGCPPISPNPISPNGLGL